jgi:hypothetical protein
MSGTMNMTNTRSICWKWSKWSIWLFIRNKNYKKGRGKILHYYYDHV